MATAKWGDSPTPEPEILPAKGAAEPMVSVVMQTYNHANFLRQAIESVMSQSGTPAFEVLVGDDCSTDGNQDVLRQLQSEHPQHITAILHPKNLGCWGKHNLVDMLKRARGKYISLLQGDDYWNSDTKMSRQFALLEAKPETSMTFGNARIMLPDGTFASERYTPVHRSPLTASSLLRYEPDRAARLKVPTGTVMYRRKFTAKLEPWFYHSKASDHAQYYHALKYGPGEYLDEDFKVYRIHGGGVFTQGQGHVEAGNPFPDTADRIRFYEGLRAWLPKSDEEAALYQIAEAYAVHLKKSREEGHRMKVVYAALKLATLYPHWRERNWKWIASSLVKAAFLKAKN